MDIFEQAKRILVDNNQIHIANFLDTLNDEEKRALATQVLELDFKSIEELYNKTKIKNNFENVKIESIDSIKPEDLTQGQIDELIIQGEDTITKNEFAVAIMAGGQGTRLRT